MEIIENIDKMRQHAEKQRAGGKRIAFVPTMGFLHEGHLSLVRKARQIADIVVVSIFVNPAQFGPSEDFDKYPRDRQRDLDMLEKEDVDIVFIPAREAFYPDGFQTYVNLEKLPGHLCGLSRPVFFKGVATVVTKLFNIIRPHAAIFGQKDYQQLLVIRRMVRDLNMDIDIIGAPIVREPDLLAMSSRNAYLSGEDRKIALCLSEALTQAQKSVDSGITDVNQLILEAEKIISSRPGTHIDYVAICDPRTLEDLLTIEKPALMALAVKVGQTRLIDNKILEPK